MTQQQGIAKGLLAFLGAALCVNHRLHLRAAPFDNSICIASDQAENVCSICGPQLERVSVPLHSLAEPYLHESIPQR